MGSHILTTVLKVKAQISSRDLMQWHKSIAHVGQPVALLPFKAWRRHELTCFSAYAALLSIVPDALPPLKPIISDVQSSSLHITFHALKEKAAVPSA